jgi:mannosyltransferase OCH1-like enzyme
LDEFVANEFPWFLPTWDSYPAKIFQIDAARLLMLYRYGGVYADLDFECLKPFEPLVNKSNPGMGCFVGVEPTEHQPVFAAFHAHKDLISNALMGSAPYHPIFEETLFPMLIARARILEKGAGPVGTVVPIRGCTVHRLYCS